MKNLLFLSLILIIASCNFNKSVSVDLLTGLTTKGNGLSCDNVSVFSNGKEASGNTFVLGSEISVKFNNIDGFKETKGGFLPGMKLVLKDEAGNMVMSYEDLYSGIKEPVKRSPASLSADLNIGYPMSAGRKYKAHIHIWDKKGKGTFDAIFEYSVKDNPAMRNDFQNTSCDAVFLYNISTRKVIISSEVYASGDLAVIYKGLKGFQVNSEGNYEPGIVIVAKDENGNKLLDITDVAAGKVFSAKDFINEFGVTFNLGNKAKGHLIHVEIMVYDRLGEAAVNTTLDLRAE